MSMKFNLSGATRSNRIEVNGQSIVQKWVEIKPTVLQRSLIHYRNHPNCQQARKALRLYSDEEIVVMTAQIPKSLWILEKEYLKSQGDGSNG